jgi:hypothetical protein
LRSAYRTRPLARTSTGLPRSARMSCDRGGCPLYPEDGGARPGWMACPAGAYRSTAASPCTPLQHHTLRGSESRGINEGSSNSPVRFSPHLRPPGWNEPPLGLSPELRTPPTKSRTTHVEVGTGHRTRTWNYTLNITSADPPIGSSLITCDIASHRQSRDPRCRSGPVRRAGPIGSSDRPRSARADRVRAGVTFAAAKRSSASAGSVLSPPTQTESRPEERHHLSPPDSAQPLPSLQRDAVQVVVGKRPGLRIDANGAHDTLC